MKKGKSLERLTNLPVTVRIGRFNGGDSDGGFQVELRDVRSGLHIANLRLGVDQAANLFSGRDAAAIAEFINDSPDIGRYHENRTVQVPMPEERPISGEAAQHAYMVALYDEAERIAGADWRADRDFSFGGGFNHHRVSKGKPRFYSVTVRRWTDVAPKEAE